MPFNIPQISIDESPTTDLKNDSMDLPAQPRARSHSFSFFGNSEPAADGANTSFLGALTNSSFLKRSMEKLSNMDPDNESSEIEPSIPVSPARRKSVSGEIIHSDSKPGPKLLANAQAQQKSSLLGGLTAPSALAGTNFQGAAITQETINALNKKKFNTNELGRWSNF